MTDRGPQATTGFTYDASASSDGPEAMLNLLLEYREAEAALRRRVADDLEIGDLDLLGLRYIARAAEQGAPLRPSDLRDLLLITTGSTTALLDRLETRGLATRAPHPTDRRSSVLELDEAATAIVRDALDGMQASILDVAEHLDPHDRATAIRVLRDLIAATRTASA
ncbi:MarR family winged helix-turn-helix transcriptional regulator [Agrococcus jejuensis]|uniref:MarR family winged helix-turn-helix transcriptional regulator n=1 Tax=Agrococcus jejuensis TaxID=399736 RepID=UPI00119D3DBB|nr:MarR family transcriptional regulator [Agrococcus jejuensis]